MAAENFKIVVLCGANSPEREVSIDSGKACFEALQKSFPRSEFQILDENALPKNLVPETDIVFPVIHGDFGEDGKIQRELENRGFAKAGCSYEASVNSFVKAKTKKFLRENGWLVPVGISFSTKEKIPCAAEIVEKLGNEVVLKPADKGSSVGLFLTSGVPELQKILDGDLSASGTWLAETRICGRELTVGILHGNAMGIVEIRPKVGVYDFKNKYTAGNTEYIFPAEIDEALAGTIKKQAERAFSLCKCRDFSRIDVLLLPSGEFYFLEIYTIPGITRTSLLPKSVACVGLDFPSLEREMLVPAIARFEAKSSKK